MQKIIGQMKSIITTTTTSCTKALLKKKCDDVYKVELKEFLQLLLLIKSIVGINEVSKIR